MSVELGALKGDLQLDRAECRCSFGQLGESWQFYQHRIAALPEDRKDKIVKALTDPDDRNDTEANMGRSNIFWLFADQTAKPGLAKRRNPWAMSKEGIVGILRKVKVRLAQAPTDRGDGQKVNERGQGSRELGEAT